MTPHGRHRLPEPLRARGGWARTPVLAALAVILTVVLVGVFVLVGGPRPVIDDVADGGQQEGSAKAPEGSGETGASGEADAEESASPAGSESPAFDRTTHSITDPTSPWVIVNKVSPLDPLDFAPETVMVHGQQVAPIAADSLGEMVSTARVEGAELAVTSAFRSYERQAQVHGDLVAQYGRAGAEALSARPGHSEHQTGLAVDVIDLGARACDLHPCFADTPGGLWVAENAWRFGWIIRYRPGEEAVTSYAPEPWHLRYVGVELATELRTLGNPALEAFFGVAGGDYPDAAGTEGAG